MKKENIIKYLNAILSVILVALLGSIFTNMGLTWIKFLNKPTNWVKPFIFPIVWSTIYSLFTIYIVYLILKNKLNKKNFVLLTINGIFNVLWCYTFFDNKNILLGLITIILNLISSILLSISTFKSSKIWGYILLIYPVWLSIATCLNLSIWILN